MRIFTQINLLILISLTLSSCLKSAEEVLLPPITMEGKNVLACYINGELYVSEGEHCCGWSPKGNIAINYVSGNTVTLISKEVNPFKAQIYIKFKLVEGQLVYELNQFENSYANVYLDVDDHTFGDSRYVTNAHYTGHVELLKFRNGEADGVNFVAGTFSFDAIDSRGDVIEVREGRFDIAFNQ